MTFRWEIDWWIGASRPSTTSAHAEVQTAVEKALHEVPEPFQSALILRDLEEMSYEEISEVLQISLGTVKSRITRGRQALRKILAGYVREVGAEMGLLAPTERTEAQPDRIVIGRVVAERRDTMNCGDVKELFSPYLDGQVSGVEMHALSRHMKECPRCTREYAALQRTQQLLAGLGPKKAPADLALKLRVAISQQVAQARARYEGLQVRMENALNAFMVPATAGLVARS